MMHLFKKLLLVVLLYTSNLLESNLDLVDHKNGQLELYLDAIRYNLQEKIGILPFLLKKPEGIYLEIGTGGDPIAELFRHIPSSADLLVIASDIDENVLKSLKIRHPELKKYLEAQRGPKLELKQLNAVNMSSFPDNYLNGINASSVVHEIISYSGGFEGLKLFFLEAFRTLKSDGILVYRDPECFENKQDLVNVALKTKTIKLFAHIFLYKFLDNRGSNLAREGRKFCLYNPQDIIFTFYKKNEIKKNSVSFEEYLQVPSYDIDFSRLYSIKMPAGLYREMSRHYLTYLHLNNPLVFVKSVSSVAEDNYFVNYWAHSTSSILKKFFKQHNSEFDNDQITLEQKNLIIEEIEKNIQALEFGIPLSFNSKKKQYALRTILQNNSFNPSLHIISVDDKTCLLDYRVFGLLYDEILPLFDNLNGPIRNEDSNHANWLKREGEETYSYYSADELISLVFELTLDASKKTLDKDSLSVLFPVSEQDNFFINRSCYSELLKESLELYDALYYPIEVFDGKRIINFQKMPLTKAIEICELIIKSSPLNYHCLQKTLERVRKHITL